MKNYYEFNKLYDDGESHYYYKSLSNQKLNILLNNEFDDIDYYLNYYAEFFKSIFNVTDYDEHYYTFKSLSEALNNIKIILNILMERRNSDE